MHPIVGNLCVRPLPRAAVSALLLFGALSSVNCLGGEALRPELRTSAAPTVDLEVGWLSPPREARTQCWWWWLNGNVTKEAITRDLKAMAEKGLGGANIIDAGGAEQRENRQVPHGPDFGSPEWRELFLHALREADRLGLELGFNIQSGWNLGGPTVTPEHAAKRLTSREVDVTGGQMIDQQLRRPRSVGGFYVDVALVAVPLPADDNVALARVDNFGPKAYYEYPGSFIAGDASHLLDVAPAPDGAAVVAAGEVLDLTDKLDADGRVRWEAPAGRWRLIRIGYTLSGARVSTHSEGWDGWAIDYLDPAAFDSYWNEIVAPLLDAAGPLVGRSLKFLHTDSWELGPVNWTPRMPERFRELRGYDLAKYWPALAGYVVDDAETTGRFLNDFRRTLAELIARGKYGTFAARSHVRGLGIHPESGGPHAAPIDALLCLGQSDVMMGEFWAAARTHRVRDFERFFTKQPASAAHVYGRRLVMAESFTSIGPHWEEDPQSLKPEFDRAACEGLNQVMLHTFDCSPASMGVPGQAYFAGSHINPQITWWRHADAFFGYLNRCQFLLQQGLPVSDVLYFYGENVPSFVRLKRDDPAGVLPGYDYDVINLDALITRTHVEDGRIVLPDGVSYEVLALPAGNCYGLAALEHVATLVDAGARVVGEKPTRPIGLSATPADEQRFAALADRLWSGDGESQVSTGSVRDALTTARIAPDFQFDAPADRGGIPDDVDYIHRRTTEADIYFVANRGQRPIQVTASFRIAGRQPELWDAVTGNRIDAIAFSQADGRTIVPLALPVGGSTFVVFCHAIAPDARGGAASNEPRLARLAAIAGPWQVEFDPRWGGPSDPVEFASLDDWSQRPEEAIQHYSGSAVYRTTIDLSREDVPGPDGRRFSLDLGRVENVASVTVNGQPAGVTWTEPFRVDVSGLVHDGRNEVVIEVTNLWPNRLIGDARRPSDERLTATNITKFNRDSPLLPSGLLGPVELVVTEP